jgi:hypothetical protein
MTGMKIACDFLKFISDSLTMILIKAMKNIFLKKNNVSKSFQQNFYFMNLANYGYDLMNFYFLKSNDVKVNILLFLN